MADNEVKKILDLRLINGEMSKEEYDELFGLLSRDIEELGADSPLVKENEIAVTGSGYTKAIADNKNAVNSNIHHKHEEKVFTASFFMFAFAFIIESLLNSKFLLPPALSSLFKIGPSLINSDFVLIGALLLYFMVVQNPKKSIYYAGILTFTTFISDSLIRFIYFGSYDYFINYLLYILTYKVPLNIAFCFSMSMLSQFIKIKLIRLNLILRIALLVITFSICMFLYIFIHIYIYYPYIRHLFWKTPFFK